jgi:hypothetical protein
MDLRIKIRVAGEHLIRSFFLLFPASASGKKQKTKARRQGPFQIIVLLPHFALKRSFPTQYTLPYGAPS